MFDEDRVEGSKNDFIKFVDILGIQSDKTNTELTRDLVSFGTGKIDFDSFINILSKYKMDYVKTHLEGAYKDYDQDMDMGTQISSDDLLRISEELDDVEISEEDAKLTIAFIKYFARDKAKKVSDLHLELYLGYF